MYQNDKAAEAYRLLGEYIGGRDAEKEECKAVYILPETVIVTDIEIVKGKLRAKIEKSRGGTAERKGGNMKFADGHFRKHKYSLEYIFRHNGRYKSTYGKTKDECYQKRLKLLMGETQPKKASNKTMREWLNLWVEQFKKGKVTENYYKTILRYIDNICETLGDKPLKAVKPLDLQQYLNAIEKDNTRVKIACVLSDSLNKAYAVQIIKHNPFLAVELEKGETESYNALMPEKQNTLLRLIDNEKYRQLYIFCCCTGLRVSEALAITEKDIDHENLLITVNKQKTRDGKIVDKLKSKKAYRKVPFVPQLLKLVNIDTLSSLTYNAAKSYFDRLKERNPIDFVIHSFRHTFISNCYYAGIRDKQIQIWAGHSKVDTTVNTYTHIYKGSSLFIVYAQLLKRYHT